MEAVAARLVADSIADGSFRISAQVLKELANTLLRKSDKTAAEITAAVNAFAPYVIVTDSAKLVLRALELLQAHSLQFYDALIVAGAESAGCTMLFSEDMTDGAAYGSVTIVNPFQRGR